MSEETYYDMLEVSKEASTSEIKKNWKKLAMKYHPDKLPEDKREWGKQKMAEINEAYEVLSDEHKREMYDTFGKNYQQMGDGMGPSDFFSHVSSMFGNQFNQKKRPVKAEPIQVTIELTLEELYNGTSLKKEIERKTQCEQCNCTGYEDKQRHVCNLCNGIGTVNDVRQIAPGMFQQQTKTCKICNGSGNYSHNAKKCIKCNGNANILEKVTLDVTIPTGLGNGDYVKIEREGHCMPYNTHNTHNTQQRSDVIIIIQEKQHATFKRVVNGSPDLSLKIELELHESLCGFSRKITHLDGENIYIDSHDIIYDGDVKIAKNKGMPYKDRKQTFGDLIIQFQVNKPSKMTDGVKQKIYELLTSKKFNSSNIHKIPKNVSPLKLIDMDNNYSYNRNGQNNGNNFGYSNAYYTHQTHNDDSDEGGQCAQQ